MSLFKTRDWWSTSVGEEEEFDHGCLCTANVDNDLSGYDKIIIGSFQGILRIYNPNSGHDNVVEDVVVEQAFKQPILQVEVGRFSSTSDNLKLGVLHPRKLAVYNVSAISGTVEHGSQHQFTLLYEHSLQRTAFNFCYGAFGGVKGKDFICVQSMDGTLFMFEQESFAFTCFLPGALLPGAIKYMSQHDSFVTTSSLWKVEVYRYQVLAVASETSGRDESIKSGKKVAVDWTFNIGEQGLDIAIVEYPNVPTSVLVLGERNIFCLTDSGVLKYVKKLDYDPSCFVPYASLSENCINFLVGAHTKSLMVYQDVTLKWMAKMEFVPLQVCVANFKGLRGGVVSLSQSGHLEVMYLGTDPAVIAPPQVESRDLNYSTLDAEIARLMKHVRAKSANSVITPTLKSEDDLSLNVHVSPSLDDVSLATGVEFTDECIPSITLRIQMKSRLVLNEVKLEVYSPWPLACNQSSFTLTELCPNSPTETFVSVFQRFSGLPSHMDVQISATYTSAMGVRRVIMTRARLPSKLVLKPAFPVKAAIHKLTIITNKPIVSLSDIFPDMLGENTGGQGAAALGFQYLMGGSVVTVLASKTSQRYRLQSDNFERMWLPLQELVTRLNSHFKKNAAGDFRITFDGALPLEEYFELVDKHFTFRTNVSKCKEMLAQRSSQFRTIQKRLLTRFKDKTPAALQNLDTLLEGTYRQILVLADTVNENWSAEQMAASNLSSGTYLLNFLLRLWANMSEEEIKVLDSTLSPVINPGDVQGWEESVDAAITLLLRTVMAKSSKELSINPNLLSQPEDTSKVKKHIALFCDRIGKGARLVDGLGKKDNSLVMSTPRTLESNEDEVALEQPAAYKLGKKINKDRSDMSFGLPQQDIQEPGLLSSILQSPPSRTIFGEDTQSQRHIESLVPDLDSMSEEPSC